MPQATKIVVHFDDGSTFEIDAATTSSVFIGENNAIKCGHHPPFKTPPGQGGNPGGNSGDTMSTLTAGSCYYVNGVVYCP